MEQKLKTIFYAMGAMILAPQTLCAQSVNIEGLDSLRLSGSVSVVEPELLKKGVLNNALDALSGQTAGVNVTTNGLDRIAMLNSVRVRGTTSIMGGNDPLVIIDGVTSDVATLATIYPADIESFTVLKNASETALYGSRGASGVIQVKTKKGTGKGFQISYEGNYGIEAMYKRGISSFSFSHILRPKATALSRWVSVLRASTGSPLSRMSSFTRSEWRKQSIW